MSRGGKRWSAGLLFSRGWTNALMQELLPKPTLYQSNGRRHRVWDKAAVLEAERDPRFLEQSPGRALNQAEVPVFRAASARAAEVLERCWAKAVADGEAPLAREGGGAERRGRVSWSVCYYLIWL